VMVVYDAVQGYCKGCRLYHTVRPLQIVENHRATLRLMRYVMFVELLFTLTIVSV